MSLNVDPPPVAAALAGAAFDPLRTFKSTQILVRDGLLHRKGRGALQQVR